MPRRGVLAATCVLVALGLLLCAGRESVAKQPAAAPEPPGRTASHESLGNGPQSAPNADHRAPAAHARPVSSEPANGDHPSQPAGRPAHPRPAGSEPAGASNANHRSPAAQSRPARGERAHRGPVSRPAHQPPVGRGAPAGRQAHARGKRAEPPGRRISSLHEPTHAPREHPEGHPRGLGPRKPVGQDNVRPHPRPRPVNQNPKSHPEHQRPMPKPLHEPQGNPNGSPNNGSPKGILQGEPRDRGDTDRPGGTRPHHGQLGESEGPPGKENIHSRGNDGSTVLSQQPGPSSGHETATDRGTDNEGGHVPTTVGKGSEGEGSGYGGTTAAAPAGAPLPGAVTRQHHDRRPASALLAGHESGSGARSSEGPARRPAKASVEGLALRSMAVRGEDPAKVAVAPSSRPPDQRVTKASRTVETVSATPEGREQRSAGYGKQPAAEAPLGSIEFIFSYLWDESSFPVQQAQYALGSMRDGARGFVTGTSHGGSLTQREPPLQLPSPFSGFGIVMGGAVFGASSSGDGGAPLLAVIFCCLSVVLWRGRTRAYGELLRPGTVPRLALERPG